MLTAITEGMWAAHHDLYLPGRIHFPCRMTVVKMTDGSLLLHSPVPIDDDLATAIAKRGEVKHIVAPNCLHHLYLQAASDRYPTARVYAPPGIEAKQPAVTVADYLAGEQPEAWADDFDTVCIRGAPKLSEVVLVHRPTRTALTVDLVFNVAEYANWQTSLLFRAVGAHKKLAQSRVWRMFTKNRQEAAESVDALLQCDFDRLVPGHGDVVESGARARLSDALHWMRKGR